MWLYEDNHQCIFPVQKPLFFSLLMKRPLGSLKPKHVAISKCFLLHHTGFFFCRLCWGRAGGACVQLCESRGCLCQGGFLWHLHSDPGTQRCPLVGTRLVSQHSCAGWGCACFSWWCQKMQGCGYLCCYGFTSVSLRWFLPSWLTMKGSEVSACFLQNINH